MGQLAETNFNALKARKALKNVAQILAGERVKVTCEGLTAFVETDKNTGKPTRINVPSVPDKCSEPLMEAIIGFMDREIAKYKYSDFAVTKQASDRGKQFLNLYSALDSIQTDRKIQEDLLGAKHSMRVMYSLWLDSHVNKAIEKSVNECDINGVVSALMVPAIRAIGGTDTFILYMDEGSKWDVVDKFVKSIPDDLLKAIPNINSSQEAYDIAARIFDERSEGGGGSGGNNSSGDGKPNKQETNDASDGQQEPQDSEQQEPQDSDEGSDSDQSFEQSGEYSKDSNSTSPDQNEDIGDTEEVDSEQDQRGNPHSSDESVEPIQNFGDFSLSLGDAINSQLHEEFNGHDYMPWTTDYDYEGPYRLSKNYQPHQLKRMEDEVDDHVAVMSTNLRRVFVANSKRRYRNGLKRGNYHPKKAANIVMGQENVFRQKTNARITDNVAVSLVVDCSGSMRGSKIQIAMTAALGLAKVLDQLQIRFEVSGFTTKIVADRRRPTGSFRSHGNARFCALNLPIFKSFDSSLSIVHREMMADAVHGGLGLAENIDGESVELAALRLLTQNRKADKHCMIVLSDGHPAGDCSGSNLHRHLKDVVARCTDSGINMVGIGINDTAVREFYPKAIVLNDIKKLPEMVVTELKNQLLSH